MDEAVIENKKELNVNNLEKLTFRIGKYELAILRCLSYVELDNSYKGVRKTIGLDPHELWEEHVNEPGISELSTDYKKAVKKMIYEYRVTFARALNSLIRKGLVYRTWEILLKSDVDGDELNISDGGKLFSSSYSFSI
jgi:hypothetical protein